MIKENPNAAAQGGIEYNWVLTAGGWSVETIDRILSGYHALTGISVTLNDRGRKVSIAWTR